MPGRPFALPAPRACFARRLAAPIPQALGRRRSVDAPIHLILAHSDGLEFLVLQRQR